LAKAEQIRDLLDHYRRARPGIVGFACRLGRTFAIGLRGTF
jgi:hypothetical protein